MRVFINGAPVEVKRADLERLKVWGLAWLAKEYQERIKGAIKPLLKFEIRQELYKMEKETGNKDACRPPKGADPVLFMAGLQAELVLLFLEESTLEVAIHDGSVVAVRFQAAHTGETGRQLVDIGYKGIGENDIRQDISTAPDGAIPGCSPVRA